MSRKYPGTYLLKTGRWRCRLYLPFSPDAPLAPNMRTVEREAATQRESYEKCQDARKAVISRIGSNNPRGEDFSPVFAVWLAEVHIPMLLAKVKCEGSSYARYSAIKSRLERFVIEPSKPKTKAVNIGQFRISKLRPHMFVDLFNALMADGVSYAARQQLKIDINQALRLVEHFLTDRNGNAAHLELFLKGVKLVPPVRQRRLFWEPDLVRTIISNPNLPVEDRALIGFQFQVLCRPSEMWALEWTDLEIEHGRGFIYKSVTRASRAYETTLGTKTRERDGRTIYFGQELQTLLRALYQARGGRFVFQRTDGNQMTGDHFSKHVWPQTRQRVGLPAGPQFYSLKHLGNSFLGDQGVDSAIRARMMGHSSDRMARSNYRTVADRQQIAAALVFDVATTTDLHGDKWAHGGGRSGGNL